MATETETVETGGFGGLYVDAAVAGLAAGIVFGAVIQFVLGRMTAVGALYTLGEPSLSVGWVAHMGHSALFAIIFGLVTRVGALREYVRAPTTGLALGVAFGAALWLVNIGFVWPVWLNTIGVMDLPVPYLAPRPLVGHLVWGAILGAAFPLLRARR